VEVGPPDDAIGDVAAWPGDEDVENLREAIKLTPPKGGEFGKTEVFYLKVRDRDRSRAVGLASALCKQFEASFQKLRDAKAASMVGEVRQAMEAAAADLAESSARLAKMERQVGGDLAELRILQDTGSAESVLRRSITEIRNELRQARATQNSHRELLALLQAAQSRPDRIVAMPNALLESQPALRRLKDGLIDAQLRGSELLGRMSAEHPTVIAAKASEAEIGRHVHDELANAARAVEVDLRLVDDRIALLEGQLAAANRRLEKVAGLRAPYAALVAEVKKRTEMWERDQQRLADARSGRATANSGGLISRIDSPDTGTRPAGPSRAVIALVSLVAGLATGFGVVLLTIDPKQFAPESLAIFAAGTAGGVSAGAAKPGAGKLPVSPRRESGSAADGVPGRRPSPRRALSFS
jgi:polysaccharide biosynthesis transport protein